MKELLRNWIKKRFNLYDIKDLTIGGHCGCCGVWIATALVPADWPYSICSKCLKIGN